MSPIARDPLALVAIQAGSITPPKNEAAAAGSNKLDAAQRSIEIGEPVPIVFARRRDGAGGVLISPGATECRFTNNTSNDVTAYYHLVLSEGQIDSIPVKDVFQRSCRVGSHSQTYSRRAGSWDPGNLIVQRGSNPLPDATYYCGSKGVYTKMSTLSFQVTIPNGSDQWKRQVHCFIRGGIRVTRLFDNTYGSSDNFADLVQWMLINSGRLPASLIDTDALTKAAKFLEANVFRCNCWITKSSNFTDLLAQWAPFFLLCESNIAGKRGLRPLLPTTSTGAIDTSPVVPVYNFTEDNILPDTFEIEYTSLTQRNPFIVQIIWRQQLEDDFGIIRTAEVRYAGTSDAGPFESHDLSEFCTRESHAVKVGAYILAKRRYVRHSIRFTAKPEANNVLVKGGDIIRVRLQRQTNAAGSNYHDFLYQVERVSKTLSGELSYECTHFPIDQQGRSRIAMDVVNTQPTGILLTSNRTGVTCDVNSSTDNSVPAESFSSGTSYQAVVIRGSGADGAPNGSLANPSDGLDRTGNVPIVPPRFRDPNGNEVPPAADAIVEDYNPCGNGIEPSRAYYVNGQLVASSSGLPVLGRVVGSIIGSYAGGQTFEILYYCPDANGQPVLTAKTQPIVLGASTRGAPVAEQVFAGLTNQLGLNPVDRPYPDGYVEWGGPTGWIASPVTTQAVAANVWAWGGVNNRRIIDWVTVRLRYANGQIDDFSGQVVAPPSGIYY